MKTSLTTIFCAYIAVAFSEDDELNMVLSTVQITNNEKEPVCLGFLLSPTIVEFPEEFWAPNTGMMAKITCLCDYPVHKEYIELENKIEDEFLEFFGSTIIGVKLREEISDECFPQKEILYMKNVEDLQNNIPVTAITESEDKKDLIPEKFKVIRFHAIFVEVSHLDNSLVTRNIVPGEPLFHNGEIVAIYVPYFATRLRANGVYTRIRNNRAKINEMISACAGEPQQRLPLQRQ